MLLSNNSVQIVKLGVNRLSVYDIGFFTLILLTAWSPFKLLAYLLPILLVIWSIFQKRDFKLLWGGLGLTGFIFFSSLLSYINSGQINISGTIASLITYFSIALFFLTKKSVSDKISRTMPRIIHNTILIQASIGIIQALSGFLVSRSFSADNGDRVEGTIDLPLPSSHSFANVMFAANILFSLIYLFPHYAKKRYLSSALLGGMVFILGSVVHMILMFFIAITMAVLIVSARKLSFKNLILIAVMSVFGVVSYGLLTTNLAVLPKFVDQLLGDQTPKAVMISRVFEEIPDHQSLFPLIGFGPGQFNSRAGLIMTGRYFGGFLEPKVIPGVDPIITPAQDRYMMDLWKWTASNKYFGSTHQPFFSWLSFYAEFGILAFFILLITIIVYLAKAITFDHSPGLIYSITIITSVILLFLLGFQENYWETPQAIALGIVLIVLRRQEIESFR